MTNAAPSVPRFAQLYVEPIGGVAGDMLLAALLHLGADQEAVEAALRSLGLPGLGLAVMPVEVRGERALRVRSIAAAPEPPHRHHADIVAILERAEVSAAARRRALAIFDILIEAEASVHGGTPGEVHLHEVGQLDSILDVLGIAVAYDSLGEPPVGCGPLPSGHGTVDTAHGVLDVPVPAVRAVAERFAMPLEDVPLQGETVTPTGIAVLAALQPEFGPRSGAQSAAVGVGAGTRQFSARPNVVRVYGYDVALDVQMDRG